MLSSFFNQPTWPVAIATLAAAISTLVLQAILTRRTRHLDEDLRVHAAHLGERNADTASSLRSLKEAELKSAATSKWADLVERRADRLHEEFAELLGLLDMIREQKPEEMNQFRSRLVRLCHSISLSLTPRGSFAEELNIQLGLIRAAAADGALAVVDEKLKFVLRTNVWKILDADRDRVIEGVIQGGPADRRDLTPERWHPDH